MRPRRRGLASINAEIRDGIVPAAEGVAMTPTPPPSTDPRVQQGGRFSFKNCTLKVPKAFAGKTIAIRPTQEDGLFDVYFRATRIKSIDLRQPIQHS